MPRLIRIADVGAAAAVLVVVVACSSGQTGSSPTPNTSNPSTEATAYDGNSLPSSPGKDAANASDGTAAPRDPLADVARQPATPEAKQKAEAVVASVRDKLPYTAPELACLVDRVARNQNLLDLTAGGVDQSSPAYSDVLALGQACVQAVTFAPQYAAGVQREMGGTLTPAQVQCLVDKYAALPTEVLSRMNTAAVDGTAPDRAALAAQLDELVASCGVFLPK